MVHELWVSYEIPEKWAREAKDIRSKRDAQYWNIFSEKDTDLC